MGGSSFRTHGWIKPTTGQASTMATGPLGLAIDVKRDYGASGSATTTTGSMTSGNTTLTLAAAEDFANGQGISVAGAGTSGALLVTSIVSGAGTTTLVLADAAGTTVSDATVSHDDTAAIQNAFNDGMTSGNSIYIPGGTYRIASMTTVGSGSLALNVGLYADAYSTGINTGQVLRIHGDLDTVLEIQPPNNSTQYYGVYLAGANLSRTKVMSMDSITINCMTPNVGGLIVRNSIYAAFTRLTIVGSVDLNAGTSTSDGLRIDNVDYPGSPNESEANIFRDVYVTGFKNNYHFAYSGGSGSMDECTFDNCQYHCDQSNSVGLLIDSGLGFTRCLFNQFGGWVDSGDLTGCQGIVSNTGEAVGLFLQAWLEDDSTAGGSPLFSYGTFQSIGHSVAVGAVLSPVGSSVTIYQHAAQGISSMESNLLYNGSGENNLTGWIAVSGALGDWATDLSGGPTGAGCINFTGSSASQLDSLRIPVVPSVEYTVSGWVNNETANGDNYLKADIFDATGAFLLSIGPISFASGSGWTFGSASYPLPSTAAYARVACDIVNPNASGSNVKYAFLQFQKGSVATQYTPGALSRIDLGAFPGFVTAPASPLVSGTVYQNTSGVPITIYLSAYATSSSTAGTVTSAIGATSTTTATMCVSQISSSSTSSAPDYCFPLRVPPGWWYMFTASDATIAGATIQGE